MEDIFEQARKTAGDYAERDTSLETVQNLVMSSQPPDEAWQFVRTYTYALPGRWVWVVLLWADTGNVTPDGLRELRMKTEMVTWDEEEHEYYIKSPFED